MGALRRFFRYRLVERHQHNSIGKQRIAFVQAALLGRAVGPVYLLATGVTKPKLEEFLLLTPDEAQQIGSKAYLSAYGVVDMDGHKHFFYENWFADYNFNRSRLHEICSWPKFTRHFVEVEF